MADQVFRRVDGLGRTIIPAELRRATGLKPGAQFTTELVPGGVLIRALRDTCPVCGGSLSECDDGHSAGTRTSNAEITVPAELPSEGGGEA